MLSLSVSWGEEDRDSRIITKANHMLRLGTAAGDKPSALLLLLRIIVPRIPIVAKIYP